MSSTRRKGQERQKRSSSRRSAKSKSSQTFKKGELVLLKSSGKLYLVKILRAKKSRLYDVEYVHYDDQYTESVAHKRLLKYDEGRHNKILTMPKATAKHAGIVDVTFTFFSDSKSYNFVCSIACLLVLVCFIAETTESTAYGRFGDNSKIGLDPRIGWWLMELPCSTVFVYQFWIIGGPQQTNLVPRILGAIFTMHYLYRGWLFPALIKVHNNSKNFSIVPAVFSWMVTITHAYLNARWFSHHGKHFTKRWLKDARFVIGCSLYYIGLVLIIWHDTIQRDLRPCPGDERYCIPRDGLFHYVSSAQYFAELVCWSGFAIMSWGPNGLFILCVSLVNLIPRSAVTHQWYIEKFGNEYIQLNRQRLIPGVW